MFHSKATEYIFFWNTHETFLKTNQISGHNTILHKFEKIEIIASIISDHNAMKPEIKYKKFKDNKYMEVKQHATKWSMGHQKYQKNKFKKCLEANDNGTTICQKHLRGDFLAIEVYLKKQEKFQ